jgi:hypothetical protein
MKIYITRDTAGSIISGGLERLNVWFIKPSYYYRAYEPDETFHIDTSYPNNYSQGALEIGWRVIADGSVVRSSFSFGAAFGYIDENNENNMLATYVWQKLKEHFLNAPFREWENIEMEKKSFCERFFIRSRNKYIFDQKLKMGTHGKTIILDEQHKEIICLYTQYDSYPSGLGISIAKYLKDKILVNGISNKHPETIQINGMGDLAVRLITYLKETPDKAGGHYLYSPMNCSAQEYNYTIYVKQIKELPEKYNAFNDIVDDYFKIAMKCENENNKVVFNDLPTNFNIEEIESY